MDGLTPMAEEIIVQKSTKTVSDGPFVKVKEGDKQAEGEQDKIDTESDERKAHKKRVKEEKREKRRLKKELKVAF